MFKRLRSPVLLLAVLLLIARPAWAVAREYDTRLSKDAKTIGVVIAAGYRAHVRHIAGLFGPRNLGAFTERNDSLLADAIFSQVKLEMEKEDRYELRRLVIEPALARKVVDSLWNKDQNKVGYLTDDLKVVYAQCACDAVLLVGDGPDASSMEGGATVGPAWVGIGAIFGDPKATKVQNRAGLLFILIDPKDGSRVSTGRADASLDFQPTTATNWSPDVSAVGEAQWKGMADFLSNANVLVRLGLFQVGLRPSCALPFYERTTVMLSNRGEEPPRTLPGSDPSKCVLEKGEKMRWSS